MEKEIKQKTFLHKLLSIESTFIMKIQLSESIEYCSCLLRMPLPCHLVLLLSYGNVIYAITCFDVEERGSGAEFKVDELKTLANLNPGAIKDCIILLGKESLSMEQSKSIWGALVKVFGVANDIPEEMLQHLGWVAYGIEPDHFSNLTMTEVDTIASFGRCNSLSKDQLGALQTAIFEQWNSKEVEDLSSFDLMVLRQVLCAFNGSEILKIHADAYKDAASELSTLTNCTKEVLQGLATLASSPQAFGDPESWTSLQVTTIGCIAAGLPSIKVISPEAMEGFTKDTITCLEPNILKELSEDHFMKLSPSAAGALTGSQLSALYSSQKYAIEVAVKGSLQSQNSSVALSDLSLLCYFLIIFKSIYNELRAVLS